MTNRLAGAIDIAEQDISEAVTIDTVAGEHMHSETLQLLYETVLNLAYGVFLVGITLSLSTNPTIRQHFTDYLGRKQSAPFVILITCLAIVSYSLSNAYRKDKKYQPVTKRAINLAGDIVKGTIFVLMIIFITSFVRENQESTEIVVAYVLYIVSMVLFKILHIIKWYYYLWGSGHNNLQPWSTIVQPEQFLSKEQKAALIEMANKHVQQLAQKNNPQSGDFLLIPETQR